MPRESGTSAAERWDARYADAPAPAATAPEALQSVEIDIPTAGSALDVACGTGAQTLWMADRGLEVVALDVSPVAIDALVRAAAETALASRVDARVVSLDDGLPADLADLDLLVCQRFRDPRLYDPFVRVLRTGGIAVVTVLSVVGCDGDPGPFHAPAGELSDAFDRPDVDLVSDAERDGVASVVVRKR